MRLHAVLAWVSLCASGVAVGQNPVAGTRLPVPGEQRTQVWEGRMQVNGHPVDLRAVQVDGSLAEVTDFYRQRLGRPTEALAINGQTTLTGIWQGEVTTVALRELDRRRVEVTVLQRQPGVAAPSAVPGPSATPGRVATAWLPSGTAVFSHLVMPEPGAHVVLLAAGNTSSVQANRDYLARALKQDGYVVTDTSPATGTQRGWVLRAQKSSQQVLVTVSDDGQHRSLVIWQREEVRR